MLLDRLAHIDFFKAQNTSAHHAVTELLADSVCWIEQTFHAFNQTSVSGRIDGSVTWRHNSSVFIQLLLGLQQDQRSRRSRTRCTNGVTNQFVGVSNVSINAGSQLRNTWLKHTFCKVIQLHCQFGRGKVNADVLLAGNRQRGVLLVVVLNLQGGSISHQCTVRQADTQSGTNFCAFNCEAVIVLTIHVAGQNQVVFENLKRFTRDHVDCENAISH